MGALLVLAASVGVAERVSAEYVFAVDAEFGEVCDVVLALPHKHKPYYKSFEVWSDRGYAVCQARTRQISALRDVVMKIEVQWDEMTVVKITTSGTLPASRFQRIVRSVALRRFAAEMREQEQAINKGLEASDE